MGRLSRYITLAIFALSVTQIVAQHQLRVELTIHMDQFQIVPAGVDEYKVVAREACYYDLEDPNLPALPMRSIQVLVPNGAELTDFSYTLTEEIINQHITLARGTAPVPTTWWEEDPLTEPAFEDSFPGKVVEYRSTMIQRGFTWFSFAFSPFKYDGVKQDLSLITHLNLEMEYQLSEIPGSIIRPDQAVLRSVQSSLINPEDLDRFYPESTLSYLKSAGDRVDYLIVTSEEFKPEFTPLLEWKTRKGLKVDIVTVEEIEELYSEGTFPLKIKHCLHDYYTRHDLTWALLGGDHDVVPVQACYSNIMIGITEFTDTSIPTDLFYACFDQRFDWNSSVDDKIGEIYLDGHDMMPEIYISRIPARNREQVRTFVHKTLTYELNPPADGFTEKLLLSGVKSWNLWEGKSDNHHRSEWIFNQYIAGNWKGNKTDFFDTGTDFTEGHEYQVSATNLSSLLNTGFGLFHFAGHGNNSTFLMETGSGFDTEDALQLTNTVSGLVLSNSCDVNAFDRSDPCLSEAFLRNQNGGCVAFFGSSRYGFGNPDQTSVPGPSLRYNASFMKYLFAGPAETRWNSFATVAALAKNDYSHNGSSSGIYHYLLYAINAMGDPELPLFTGIPSEFDKVRIYRIGNSLTINTGGVSECRICVTSLSLDEGYHHVVKDVSFHTFEHIPEAFQVTITGPNYRPYRYVYGTTTGLEEDIRPFIRIYPNPVREWLQIDFDLSQGQLQGFDMHGRLLLEQEIFLGSNRVLLTGYPEGTYIVKILSDHGSARFKVIKHPAY